MRCRHAASREWALCYKVAMTAVHVASDLVIMLRMRDHTNPEGNMHSTRSRRFRNGDGSYDWRAKNAQERELMARINAEAHAPLGERANANVRAGLCPHGATFADECPQCSGESSEAIERRMQEQEAQGDREGTERDERAKHEHKQRVESGPTVASFARLKREPGQPWGVRVPLPSNDANPGCTVTVRTRAGEEKRITLGSEVATFNDAALFTIAGERKLADDGGAKAEAIDYRRRMAERLAGRIPAGRYAVTGDDGTTDFYFVDFAEHGDWAGCVFVTLHTGGGDQRIAPKPTATILKRILDDGPTEAMQRYGHELGHCGNCGRELTNDVSREFGIGPVCRQNLGW